MRHIVTIDFDGKQITGSAYVRDGDYRNVKLFDFPNDTGFMEKNREEIEEEIGGACVEKHDAEIEESADNGVQLVDDEIDGEYGRTGWSDEIDSLFG